MEVPAHWFVYFLLLICHSFTCLGYYAVYKTELSNSVSPLVMSFVYNLGILWFFSLLLRMLRQSQNFNSIFEVRTRSLSIGIVIIFQSICSWIGISHALSLYILFGIKFFWIFHFLPNLYIFTLKYPTNLVLFSAPSLIFPEHINPLIIPVINLLVIGSEYYKNPQRDARHAFLAAAETFLLLTNRREGFYNSDKLLFLLYCLFLILTIGPKRGISTESAVSALVAKVKKKKIAKFLEFAVGMFGAVLFQNFFRLTSFKQVLVFLCFAVAWLAKLAVLRASYDFCVLNFLLSNVVVGCTVSQNRLGGLTWLAYAASLLLYGLRLRIDSLTIVHHPNQLSQVVLW